MGTRLDWTKTKLSNHETSEYSSPTSKAIHNRYDSVCSFCNKTVDRNTGLLEMVNGKWSAIHVECAMERTKGG